MGVARVETEGHKGREWQRNVEVRDPGIQGYVLESAHLEPEPGRIALCDHEEAIVRHSNLHGIDALQGTDAGGESVGIVIIGNVGVIETDDGGLWK